MGDVLDEVGTKLAFDILEEHGNNMVCAVDVIGKAFEVIVAIMLKTTQVLSPEENLQEIKDEFLAEVSKNIDDEMNMVKAWEQGKTLQ